MSSEQFDIGELTAKDVKSIIKASIGTGISRIHFRDLEIEFHSNEPIPVQIEYPHPMEFPDQPTETIDEEFQEELRLSQLDMSDPEAYEKELLGDS